MVRGALILGKDGVIRTWEFEALNAAIEAGLEISKVAYCQNDRRPKLKLRNSLYFLMAFTGRRKMSTMERVDVKNLIPQGAEQFSFESIWDSNWQTIPVPVADALSTSDVVIRFGMNLIRNPQDVSAPMGILSFHHGDMSKYRGRPAGFYEMIDNRSVMGITVQRLNPQIDQGVVRAFGHSAIVKHSYAKTLNQALAMSSPLLAKAIFQNDNEGVESTDRQFGKITGLPTNRVMLCFLAKLLLEKVKRVLYGLFRYKNWRVAKADTPATFVKDVCIGATEYEEISLDPTLVFAADPTGVYGGALFCEVQPKRGSRAEIAANRNGSWTKIDCGISGTHASYPQIVEAEGKTFLFPEISENRPPTLFQFARGSFEIDRAYTLKGLETERLFDATLHRGESDWFLFASKKEYGNGRLDLWFCDDLEGVWLQHPESPIVIDPRGARMAGPIHSSGGVVIRFGQDCSSSYGQAVIGHAIKHLSRSRYVEEPICRVTLEGSWGPHTLLITDEGEMFFDLYKETVSLVAWWPRIFRYMNEKKPKRP